MNSSLAADAGLSPLPSVDIDVAAPSKSPATDLDLDNFIDLYDLLGFSISSTGSELRKMISALYLEAQKNLDHRNTEKKLFFQQMYEVHLPRARYVLIDEKRRGEYDDHVRTFREDRAQQRAAAEAKMELHSVVLAPDHESGEAGKTPVQAQKIVLEELSPVELAARRENQWQKWQENLAAPPAQKLELPPISFTPQQIEREEKRNVYMHQTATTVREVERVRREESLRRQQNRWKEQEKTQTEAQQEIASERRQQEERRNRQVALAKTARTRWSWSSGIGLFAVGATMIFAFAPTSSNRSAVAAGDTLLGHRPYHRVPSPIPGKIELEDYDLGMESTAYHKKTRTINGGGAYRSGSGVFMVATDSGHAVTKTASGEWLDYTVNVAQSGTYDLRMSVASPSGGGTFSVSFNGKNVSGALAVPSTGDYDTFQTVEKHDVSLAAGRQVMRVAFDSAASDGSAGNFDSIEVRAGTENSRGLMARFGDLARILLLGILALSCFVLGKKIGASAEERALKT